MHPPHTRSRSIQTRLRPQSMYQTGGGRVGSEPEGVPMQVAKGPDPMRKSSTASSTGLQRSQSLRRPGAPLQPTQPGGHKRTQSTSTGAGARKGPAEARVIAERPQSLLAAPGHIASNANNASTEPITGTTRSSARLAGLQRSTSTRTKREVTERAEATGAAVRPVKADMEQQLVSAANAKRREATQDETKKIGRPAFSTLQQHFTPKKGAKPPTSAFLHPAPDVGLQALPSETASLQAELLQLHLLHSEAERTARQWELSAERTLLRRFDHVVSLYRLVRDLERQDQENKNVRALCEWSSSDPSSGLMEHIQLLAGPLHELPSLVDNEGRFTRLVGEFDRWKAWVEDIWSTRANGEELRGGDLRSAEGLGDSWKADQAALTRKLTSFTHDLDRLTQPSQGSSIACVVSTCKELLQGLADELQIMEKIEADLVVREKAWVEMRLGAIARDIGSDLFDPSPMIEAWRT
ncbi:hypothetical protein P154DRAFT_491366 [Amniculicola lignicola CBS 123094]|uniref:Uncharacterized protein n=1 Tax=Amniculicola lignicola CBS 123094 TaxID=1392246 RepID=A0A6A5WIB6_9PLEO|nr:hypothetical protein P154DRAFT_491366 [Amniculicola lignicola CBS 123094]